MRAWHCCAALGAGWLGSAISVRACSVCALVSACLVRRACRAQPLVRCSPPIAIYCAVRCFRLTTTVLHCRARASESNSFVSTVCCGGYPLCGPPGPGGTPGPILRAEAPPRISEISCVNDMSGARKRRFLSFLRAFLGHDGSFIGNPPMFFAHPVSFVSIITASQHSTHTTLV